MVVCFYHFDKLMTVCPHRRYSSLEEIKSLNLMKDVNWESIAKKEVSPLFVPPVY